MHLMPPGAAKASPAPVSACEAGGSIKPGVQRDSAQPQVRDWQFIQPAEQAAANGKVINGWAVARLRGLAGFVFAPFLGFRAALPPRLYSPACSAG